MTDLPRLSWTRFGGLMKLGRICVILGLILPSGCATSIVTVDDFCVLGRVIHPSLEDTSETRRQVDAHNAVYLALCDGAL